MTIESEDLRRRLRTGVSKLAHAWLSWDTAIEGTLAMLEARR
jgi:hypothetical protein